VDIGTIKMPNQGPDVFDSMAVILPPQLLIFARGSWPQPARGHSRAKLPRSVCRMFRQADPSTTRLPLRPADDTLRQQIRYRRATGWRPFDAGNPWWHDRTGMSASPEP